MDVAPAGGAGAFRGWLHDLTLGKPVLGNNLADAQRLEQALKRAVGSDYVHVPWELVQTLPQQLREWDFACRALVFKDRRSHRLVQLFPPGDESPVLGAAVDIGTTRIVMALVDLSTGRVLAEQGMDNPQAGIGPDVLARIHHSRQPGGLEELRHKAVTGVNQTLAALCSQVGYTPSDIYLFAGAGNTAMTHLFMGLPAWELIREPYIPCVNIPDTQPADRLGLALNPHAQAFLFPNIGSYFGGDLLAGILHADLDRREAPALMVDVGTNAEIVVGSRDWLIACAGAAGPALEGGVSKMGMTAGPGVIDTVALDPETQSLMIHTIDDQPPIGICGSGMIDLAAALFLSGRIDIRGKFHAPACGDALVEEEGIQSLVLFPAEESGTGTPIGLSQVDLNSLTSSKAAMHTILEVIVQQTAGLAFEELDRFYVAGTFGSYINPGSAISIGMLPDLPHGNFEVLGNSSLGGCIRLLSDHTAFDRVMAVRESITYVELNVNQEFMNLFSGAKFYPHTDASRFPSVKRLV